MFDLRRLALFVYGLLRVTVPFFLLSLILGMLVEWFTRTGTWADRVADVRFWLEVAADMVPITLAMTFALALGARFVRAVYQLDRLGEAVGFLLDSRFGLRSFGPWCRVAGGQLEKARAGVLCKIGGPGHLVLYNDSAVLLEKGGRLMKAEAAGLWRPPASPPVSRSWLGRLFARLLQALGWKAKSHEPVPGFPELEAFERVYDVLDLRPKRAVRDVSAMTREGIPIHWEVEVQYQIDHTDLLPTASVPYPVRGEQVLRAGTAKWAYRKGEAGILNWEGRLMLAETERRLRSILADRRLDQLVGLLETDDGKGRQSVQDQLKRELEDAAPELGARILSVKLANLRVDDRVTQEWIKAWQARWQNWAATRMAQAEASWVHQAETAKAEAQLQMLVQLTRALQLQMDSGTLPRDAIPQLVLLRLFSVLDRADFAPASRVFFPTETLRALEILQRTLSSGAGAAGP